jgi:hypothetical protein
MRCAAILALALFLGACAHDSGRSSCVEFGKGAYCLQAGAQEAAYSLTQVATLGPMSPRVILQIESGSAGMRVAGLSSFGRRLFLIGTDASGHFTVDSDVALDRIMTPQRLLAAIQLATWPRARILPGLRGETTSLQESADGTRTLTVDGTTVFSASCEGARPACRRSVIRDVTDDKTVTVEAAED